MADEIRARVIAAVEAGQLPRGGPSDAAAHNLLDDLPAGYWERWGDAAAKRIRAQRPRCCCVDGPQPGADGRCGRCYGCPDDDAEGLSSTARVASAVRAARRERGGRTMRGGRR